ncbi:MAG: hypothetical protein HZC36_15385 [Armatimonadetes bacterium]|nr:hypothetical protein [Armatimonadota bacterium]
MKKKPAPIAAVTFLVALACAVIFFGKMNQPVSEEDQRKMAEQEAKNNIPKTGESRPTVNKSALGVSLGDKSDKQAPGPPEDNPTLAPVPTILKANKSMFRPTPNESDLQPQWYKKDKLQQIPGEKK